MKIKAMSIYLFLFILLTSCSKEEICPEHEQQLICSANAFIGTWEFVGYDFEIEEGTCLSTLETVIDPEKDITIERPADPKDGDLFYSYSNFRLRNGPCRATKISNSLTTNLLFNEEITLSNPNYLHVCSQFILGTTNTIYRRKT